MLVVLAAIAALLGLLFAYVSLESWFGEEPNRLGGVLALLLGFLPAVAVVGARNDGSGRLLVVAGAGPTILGGWAAVANGGWLLLAWPALWYGSVAAWSRRSTVP